MALLKKFKTVRQALIYVKDNPGWPSDRVTDRFEMPAWEMMARNIYDMASLRPANRTEMNMATRAQKILLDRLGGTRRMGTNPAVRRNSRPQIVDLTLFGDEVTVPKLDEDDD